MDRNDFTPFHFDLKFHEMFHQSVISIACTENASLENYSCVQKILPCILSLSPKLDQSLSGPDFSRSFHVLGTWPLLLQVSLLLSFPASRFLCLKGKERKIEGRDENPESQGFQQHLKLQCHPI